MAGTGDHGEPEGESERLKYELAYRNDLWQAIGIIVVPPANRFDDEGNLVWGSTDNTLTGNRQVFDELGSYLAQSANQILKSSETLPPTDRKAPTHTYEIPPAAQSWPQIAVMLWEHGKPYLENTDLVLSLALAVRELGALTHKWFEKKNREIAELNREDYETGRAPTHEYVTPEFMLTQGAIVSLVVANLVERFGFNPDLELEVYPRGLEGYNDPGHPNQMLTYLIRCSFADRIIMYVVTSSGNVIEHFELRDTKLTPLPAPNLLAPEETWDGSVPGENGLHLQINEQPPT